MDPGKSQKPRGVGEVHVPLRVVTELGSVPAMTPDWDKRKANPKTHNAVNFLKNGNRLVTNDASLKSVVINSIPFQC
jgi:hypothetical protein